jgi:pyruvate-formate lyase-activating enzyme
MDAALQDEEAALKELIAIGDATLVAVARLCELLREQGRPIPPAVEEASLRLHLETQPERIDWLQRLCSVLEQQGKPIPLELEERTLIGHLQALPDRNDLRARLDVVQRKLGKLSRERENELRLAELQARHRMPSNLYVQITNHCNLRCVMCAHKTAIKDNAFMDEALFHRVLDEAAANRVDNLIFASAFGETLLHPDAVSYLTLALRRGFKVLVATNGNFLDAARIEELAALGLHCIQYSFFGFDASSYEKTYVNGKFDKALENLRLLKEALKRHGSRTKLMVNGINVVNDPERARKTRRLLASLGIEEDEIRFSMPNNFAGRISPGTFAQSIGAKSFKEVDRLPLHVCPQLLWSPGVMVDGRFTACGCLDNNGALSLGDIRTSTIAEMRAGERYETVLQAFVSGDLSQFPMCAKCDVPYGPANEKPA